MSLTTTGGSHDYETIIPNDPTIHPPPTVLPVTEVPAWLIASVTPQYTDSSSPFYRTFLKSKPKALGIALIVAAVLEIALGIVSVFSAQILSKYSGVSLWGPVFYIIAGSLTIGSQTKPSVCLVKGSLGLNIISSIVSAIALSFNIADIAVVRLCYGSYNDSGLNMGTCIVSMYVLSSLLLVINVLVFCITLSVSIFGCRSLSHVQTNVTQVFVIQSNGTPSMDMIRPIQTSELPPADGYSNVV